MLTIDDCIGLSGLDEDEIDAIAEHEHIPEMAAVEMGYWLNLTEDGQREIGRFLVDDLETARARHHEPHATALAATLRHFVECHPCVSA